MNLFAFAFGNRGQNHPYRRRRRPSYPKGVILASLSYGLPLAKESVLSSISFAAPAYTPSPSATHLIP